MKNNLPQLEEQYLKYTKDIQEWLPEGVIDININILHNLNLLNYHMSDKKSHSLTRYFQVIESFEKITLINEQFVIWIVPEKINDTPITYVLIALNAEQQLQLEIAFSTWGIYNSSRLVLRVLEKFLHEIQETEELLVSLK